MARRPSKKTAKRHPAKSTRKSAPAPKKRPRAAAKPKSAPAASAPTHKALALEHLHWCHGVTESAMKGWPEDKACAQAPGQPNHLLWTVGHLATSYEWFASMLDGKPKTISAEFQKMFGYQSVPHGDASKYPALADVRRTYEENYKRLVTATENMSESDMHAAPLEDTMGFAKTRHEIVVKTAWHDGWHLGQLSVLRRFLGLPGFM